MNTRLAVAGSVMVAGLVAVGGVAVASTWQPTPARQSVEFVQPAADTSTPTTTATATPTATVAPAVVPTTQAPAPVAEPTAEPIPVRVAVPQADDPTTEAPAPPEPTVVPTVDPTSEPAPEITLDTTPNAADVAPVWHQATCELPDGSVDIPAVDGVQYDLDVIPGPAGNYSLGVGDHTVTVFGSDRAPTWTFTVDAPTGC